MEFGALTLNLKPEIRSKLNRLARMNAIEPAYLVSDVLRQYLHIYEQHYAAIVEGVADADAGRVVDHDHVVAWIESWDTHNELEQPWFREAESRVTAYERGEIEALPGDQVIRKLRSRTAG